MSSVVLGALYYPVRGPQVAYSLLIDPAPGRRPTTIYQYDVIETRIVAQQFPEKQAGGGVVGFWRRRLDCAAAERPRSRVGERAMPVKTVGRTATPEAPLLVEVSAQCNDPAQRVTVENGGQVRIAGDATNRGIVQSRARLQFDGKCVDVPIGAGDARATFQAVAKALPKGYRAEVLSNPSPGLLLFEVQRTGAQATTASASANGADLVDEAAGRGPTATVRFGADYGQSVQGRLSPGGTLSIEYDPGRAQIKSSHHGFPCWGVQAYVRIVPGGQVFEAPAVEFGSDPGRTTLSPRSRPVSIEIPGDARQIQVWFKNWTGAEGPRECWDSNFGKNYTFDVAQ